MKDRETMQGKRGSIALARSLCYEIAGATSEDDMDGGGYGSVDIAEILSAEVERLQKALAQPVFDCPRCGHCCPEAEPVAWMFQHDETGRMNYVGNDGIHNPTMFLEMNPRYALVCPLYTTPPQQQAEPVAYEHHEYRPYGAPGEIRIHAILASQYMMPDGSVAGDFQWLVDEYKKDKNTIKLIPLYTSPPQRPWVGLTDGETNLLWENTDDRDSWELIKRVEAKLKERNT